MLLQTTNLRVSLPVAGGKYLTVARDVSFSIPEGGFHCVVGESGCGKSVTAMALTRLPPADNAVVSGEVMFCGENLLTATPARLRELRGRGGIANIFQDPMSALNPVLRVDTQMREVERDTGRLADLLASVGLPDPRKVLRSYPCELSGGMAQRVCIAMAMASDPALLIADEPTTALDVVTQKKVLELLAAIRAAHRVAILLITHNLGLVAGCGDTLSVMYAGQIVEDGPAVDILRSPAHPYTAGLMAAAPSLAGGRVEDLATIPGRVPPPAEWPEQACAFAPRCARATPDCFEKNPVNGQRGTVNGQRLTVNGERLTVNGQRSTVNGRTICCFNH